MNTMADKLFGLLPAVHRERDAAQGGPLRELIAVIAAQFSALEENLDQLYDNHFVETAAPWALPYIADLLGIRGLSGSAVRTLTPRSEIGHTVAYRRRKGTASMLELLARDVTGRPACVVEFFERLAATQHVNHARPHNRAVLSVRQADALEHFDGPFETATRTVEVRRIAANRGKWNVPNIGIFLWRIRAASWTRTPLVPARHAPSRCFHLHPLRWDVALVHRPWTEDEFAQLAGPVNAPLPITRRLCRGLPSKDGAGRFHPSSDFYGPGRSVLLERRLETGRLEPLAVSSLIVADLSDVRDADGNVIGWARETYPWDPSVSLFDPVLGRVVLSRDVTDVHASFHYGMLGNLGGGEYHRAWYTATEASDGIAVAVGNTSPSIEAPRGFERSCVTVSEGLGALGPRDGTVEILDSGRYEESIGAIDVATRNLEIRAAEQCRPTLIIEPAVGSALVIKAETTPAASGVLTLDGVLLAGTTLRLEGNGGRLRLRHCTLAPARPGASDAPPSLVVTAAAAQVEIDSCVLGAIRVAKDASVVIRDSIVDAGAAGRVVLAGLDETEYAGSWSIENCTIRGKVKTARLPLASNTIFLGESPEGDNRDVWPAPLIVRVRQSGCVRYCWLPPGALVPRRHRCLPNSPSQQMRPVFTSLRIGDAAYGQLDRRCPAEILHGADDDGELGAFHHLHQPHREAYLRGRLDEYLRFGLETGVFFAT